MSGAWAAGAREETNTNPGPTGSQGGQVETPFTTEDQGGPPEVGADLEKSGERRSTTWYCVKNRKEARGSEHRGEQRGTGD